MINLAEILREILEEVADETSMVSETAIDITGPIDLEEFAAALHNKLSEISQPGGDNDA